MNRIRAFRLIVSLGLALLAVSLGGTSFVRKVQSFQPLGFELAGVQGGGVTVAEVGHEPSGLRPGDVILLAQGAEISDPADFAQRLRKQPETELAVLRAGQLLEVTYHRPPLDVDLPYVILSMIGLVYLLIGLFTLLRQGSGPAFLFSLWALASAAFYLLSASGPLDLVYVAVSLGDEVARLFLPALTLHLFLVFPHPVSESRWSRRLTPFLYLPTAVLLALQLDLALTGGRWIFGQPTEARIRALDRVELAHLAVYALATVALLVYRRLRGRVWEQQRQLQWVTYGLAGGYLPFLALHGIPFVLGLRGSEWLNAAAVLPLAVVPLTFAWAILRYKLWDIEVIVRDTISLTMTLLLGVFGFSLANLAITRGVSQDMTLARSLLTFATGLGIAGLLVPTRTGISSLLERLQYRGTFGKRRALSELGRELLHERDLGMLCSALLRQVEDGVDLERTSLYLTQGDALLSIRPQPELPMRLAFEALGEDFWQRDLLQLSGLALPVEALSPAQRLFIAGYRYAFPLTVRGRGIGIVLASFKRDGSPLNSDDTELIRHLLNQAALAIENAQLVGQLHLQLEEVRSLQSYSEGIFESSPAGIAVLDEECRLVSANAAFAGIVGQERTALPGRALADLLPVESLPCTGQGPAEIAFTDPAGRGRHLQVSLSVFEGQTRESQQLRVLVVHDVTERVAMENALKEQDRLAALGMLAAGVAHEVNTPITGISSYAQMLLSDTPEGHPHYEILKKVERQTFRASRIVNNLLEFARQRSNEPGPVAVAPLLTECVDLLGERLEKRRIEVRWELPEQEVLVMGCDGELQQVFTNLVLNAFDAMTAPAAPGDPTPIGGRLTVRLEADEATVRIVVQDSGPGVPPDKLEAIFQPFYTTKLHRGGTGLGLPISFEIVRRHRGDLKVVSRPGEGACFVVELPRHTVSAEATA